MSVIGLDLSLSGTGVCVQPLNGGKASTCNIGTKPKDGTRLDRCATIAKELADIARQGDFVFIEDYAWGAKGSLVTLAELGGIVKLMMWRRTGHQPFPVSQTLLKKWFCGGSTCKKEMIPVNVNKKYDRHFKTHDEYVAYAVADLGLHLLKKGSRELFEYESKIIKSLIEKDKEKILMPLQALAEILT